MSEDWNTRESIIKRIQVGTDDEAWEEFEACYRPFIYFLLKQVNVDFSERDDVVQEILLNLHKNIRKYIKQKSRFRTWLGTVIRNTAKNHIIKRSRYDKNLNKYHESLNVFESYSNAEIDDLIENQWKQYLVDCAMERMRNIFADKALKCFEMTLNNRSVEEIAEELDVKKDTVYIIRNRIKARMLVEIRQLTDELEF
ncbi:sigma-70 family RNA polymerase sigma factor [Lentisphaera profundi]|jgi:RNA polymerase sigma factor (sigma-70 family)|uniref:Sigma-70 family RNA polymerase sigma factor n=1 Tax=Lentisphaera profundi TaxID=1658616 RepID=A0ABY7VUZ4_9BACT|nr:sigma-70 family RNA polymerase sigma factor [Lentisphaera profundi]WDE97711.1 sigma-70 family RNA polymerase sigma factor [Lentisphaera profundi]